MGFPSPFLKLQGKNYARSSDFHIRVPYNLKNCNFKFLFHSNTFSKHI